MADAPEHYVPQSQPQHSTLEPYQPAHGLYKPPADSEGLQATSYQQGGQVFHNPDGSPSPGYVSAYAKEAQGYVQPSHAAQGVEREDGGKGSWKKRRICGIAMPLFIGLIILLVLVGAGAIVGGLVGTKSKDNKSAPQVENDLNLDPTPSISSRTATTTTKPTSETSSATTLTSASATATAESQFKPDYWHRFTNNFLGAGRALDIFNEDGKASRQLNMSTTGDFQGQSWQLLRIPIALQTKESLSRRQSSSSSTPQPQYWISTFYLGQSIRLEVSSSDSILPKMANADNDHLGQRWWADQWEDDGAWALSNEMNGRGWNMSTYADTNELFMRIEKEDSGQHWNVAQGLKIVEKGWEVDAEKMVKG